MNKLSLLLVCLAVGAAQCQSSANDEAAGAPEPYAYGYQTDTHAAAEERSPDGTVRGYYTLADADGRQRKVEYVADESGYRAKVLTNEVGTKTSNPAHAEIVASEPTRAQLVVGAQLQQQQPQVGYLSQQQAQIGYLNQPGWLANQGYNSLAGYSNLNGVRYVNGLSTANGLYGLNSGLYGGQGYQTLNNGQLWAAQPINYGLNSQSVYGGYNYHTPASYYAARGVGQGQQYLVGQAQRGAPVVSYSSSVQHSGSSSGQPIATSSLSAASASNQGSSNYIVLKK